MIALLVRIPADAHPVETSALETLLAAARKSDGLLDLGEAWAGLHFALTGEGPIPKEEALRRGVEWFEGSLENVLFGGRALPFGPHAGFSRIIPADEVKTLAGTLEALSVAEFGDGFTMDDLNDEEIPPGAWTPEQHAELSDLYGRLRALYMAAAAAHQSVLVHID